MSLVVRFCFGMMNLIEEEHAANFLMNNLANSWRESEKLADTKCFADPISSKYERFKSDQS